MKVLLAINDSEISKRAVQMVIEQAQRGETEVRVLYVRQPPALLVTREMAGYDTALENVWERQTEAAETMVKNVAASLRASGVQASWCVELGEPKATILESAEKWHADLIVMGCDAPTRLAGYWRAGIPEAVVRRARCSVEIVRATQKETTGMV